MIPFETSVGDHSVYTLAALRDNYIYALKPHNSEKILIIDPGEAEPVREFLVENGLKLDKIVLTHHHWDHTSGIEELLSENTGVQVIGSKVDEKRIPGITQTVSEGDVIDHGPFRLQVIAVPGHTLGAVFYYDEDLQMGFTGDTLFAAGCGRLFEGSAQQMHESLDKIAKLPSDTRLFCGHEYTAANLEFAEFVEPENPDVKARAEEVRKIRLLDHPTMPTTVKEELQTNPFLRTDSENLRKKLGLHSAEGKESSTLTDADVFKELRLRKDTF